MSVFLSSHVTLFCPFVSVDLPQLVINNKEEVLIEQQQHCNQERNSRLVQEEAAPLLIKEEQGEDCSSKSLVLTGDQHLYGDFY